MSTIVLRSVKGSPLTNTEVDTNFSNLNTDKVESVTSSDGSIIVTTTGTTRNLAVSLTSPASVLVEEVRNSTGATLTKGTAVFISGATGQKPTVSKALATGDATSAQTLGLITTDIANNANGYVTIIGLLANFDTSAFTDGAQLYLSPTTAGTLTATKPYAPQHLVYVAVVAHAHPSQGKLLVKVQNGYVMDELHNVSAQNAVDGQVLIYNNTTNLWVKANITGTASQVTVTNGAGSIALSLPSPINVNTSGSAATLTTGRTIAITGDLGYTSPSFNGSANVTAAGTLATVNANVGSFTNASFTVNAKGLITAASSGAASVTSVTGTSPVASSDGATPNISLAASYGDTQNPYASKTANFVLAAPNGAAGVPTFRAVVAADIPTLNQNTTGSSGSCTGNAATATTATNATNATTATNQSGGSVNATTGSFTGLLIGASSASTDINAANDTGSFSARGSSSTVASMSFNRTGAFAINVGLSTSNNFVIGGWSATANAFSMSSGGNLTMTGNISSSSDERVKTNWRDLQPDFIERLAEVKHGIYDRTDQELTQIGVGAQSLRPIMEHAVLENEDGELSVSYGNTALVACIKLAQRVLELEKQLKERA